MSTSPQASPPAITSSIGDGELVAPLAHLLGPHADRDKARDILDVRLSGVLDRTGLLGAFVFVWDAEVGGYVLVHSCTRVHDLGELRRSIQRLVRRLGGHGPTSSLSNPPDSDATMPQGVTARRLDYEGTPVGAIAMLGAKAAAFFEQADPLLAELTVFLLAYQHSVRMQELQRGQRELVSTQARLETVLRELEGHSHTIEHMNQELLRFRAHARRVATLGELVAGVAHEINNPLAYVLTSLDFIQEQLEGMRDDSGTNTPSSVARDTFEDLLDAAADATDGARRIRDIARDLRSLSRAGDHMIEAIGINDAISSAIRVTAPQVRPHAVVITELEPDLRVVANAGQLSQVIANLLINAGQAIGSAGIQAGEIRVTAARTDDLVTITVADNGPGIPEHLRKQVLDPFFTTKPEGQGTGLGLSISCEIVQRFSGELSLNSEIGRGTTFRIDLPAALTAAVESPATEAVPSTATRSRPRRSRLLFIDEEPAMLRSYAQHFGVHHHVTLATGLEHGCEILERSQDFDLVVCDAAFGPSGSTPPWVILSSRWPSMLSRTVFVTASIEHETPMDTERSEFTIFEKPFDLARLDEILLARQQRVGPRAAAG